MSKVPKVPLMNGKGIKKMNAQIQYHAAGAYRLIDTLQRLAEKPLILYGITPLLDPNWNASELKDNIVHLRKYVQELELASMMDKTIL